MSDALPEHVFVVLTHDEPRTIHIFADDKDATEAMKELTASSMDRGAAPEVGIPAALQLYPPGEGNVSKQRVPLYPPGHLTGGAVPDTPEG